MDTKAAVVVGRKNKQLARSKLKNILCRPDRDLWPCLDTNQSRELGSLIRKYSVDVPATKRLPWSVLKLLSKEERPKLKRTGTITGLIFGIAQVARLLKSAECSGVILDSGVNPRILVKHIIEAASKESVPVVCIDDLKIVTSSSFGFPSCCLALKKSDLHKDIKAKVAAYWNAGNWEPQNLDVEQKENNVEKMELHTVLPLSEVSKVAKEPESTFTYLMRTSKTHKAFVPPSIVSSQQPTEKFSGQNFIKFSNNEGLIKKHAYKSMILKRVSGNPNRKNNKAKKNK